jgi:hypothetical protein
MKARFPICTLIVGTVAVALALPLAAQRVEPTAPQVMRMTRDLRYLADDAREGRGVGTAGLDSAAAYLARAFEVIGLEPAGIEGYFQPFEISPTAPGVAHTDLGGSHVKNVVAVMPGRGSLADEYVVVGAHYDHLGYGLPGASRDPDSVGVVHNGADDNASGTVAMLEMARLLVGREASDHRGVIFIAFTAEEIGAIGSQYYVQHPVRPNEQTVAMLNFDMVGRMRGDTLIVDGIGSSPELQAEAEELNGRYGFDATWGQDPWGASDHSSFYAQGVPVVHFFTNIHDDYHRTTDDWHRLNPGGIVRVAMFGADLAWGVATRDAPLTLVQVERPRRAGGGARASLGTVPDMTGTPGGVRLAGVRAGTAAEEGGLEQGDILVQVGEIVIESLSDLQRALTTYSAGDTVTVAFLRDGERHEVQVTLR